MPHIEAPFGEVDKPVEPGMYLAEISGAQIKTVKNPDSRLYGCSMIDWEWTIIEQGPMMGRKLHFNSNLNDRVPDPNNPGQFDSEERRKGVYFLNQFLDTIGCPKTDEGFNTEDALHCKGVLKVVSNTYKGKQVANVEQVLPATGN